jgi:hypothetical protein
MIDRTIAPSPMQIPTELAQHADLDQVVESEGKDGAARCSCADRGQAAGLVGTLLPRKEPVPAARAKEEAGEVGESGGGGEQGEGRARDQPATPRRRDEPE